MGKRILVAVGMMILLAITAQASACTTTTYFGPDGRVVICTTCCYGNNCQVTCF